MSRSRARVAVATVMLSSIPGGLAFGDASVAAEPAAGAIEILPPDETWGGLSRGEWDARWWQWILSTPADVNPGVDASGERCGHGQSGPVFFLPGSFGGVDPVARTCVVAEGTAIYVTPANVECSTVEPPPFFGRTEAELRACATAGLDEATDYRAQVNGQEVVDLDAYRTGSPLFTITFPEANIFGVQPGVAQAVSEAYSFIIAPPPPGQYEIAVSTNYVGEPEPFAITVNLVVEAPQVIEGPPTS